MMVSSPNEKIEKRKKRLLWEPKGRITDKKEEDERLNKVLELYNQGHSDREIGYLLNPRKPMSRFSIYNYKKELIKRGLLQKDEYTGRAVRSTKALFLQKWNRMEKLPFMQIPEIRKTWETMKRKNKGRGLKYMGSIISRILTFCNTLEISPKDLLSGVYGHAKELKDNAHAKPDHLISLTYAMEEFLVHMNNKTVIYNQDMNYTKNDDPSILGYVSAMRELYACNGKPVPRGYGGKGHIISGAKENFGAYNHVQLSYGAKLRGIEWFKGKYDMDYARFFAFMSEMIVRTKSLYRWMPSFAFKTVTIDGVLCEYATTEIHESKTEKYWSQKIFDPVVLEIAKNTPHGERLIKENFKLFESRFNQAMREFYVSEKLLPATVLLPRKDPLHPKYKRFTTEYFLTRRSTYALRHSSAHMWMRRSNYNAEIVAKKGWEDTNTLVKAYAELPDDYELQAGTCHYCDPPEGADNENPLFCNPRHALVYLQNGNVPKNNTKISIA